MKYEHHNRLLDLGKVQYTTPDGFIIGIHLHIKKRFPIIHVRRKQIRLNQCKQWDIERTENS